MEMKYQKIKHIRFTIAETPNEKNWVEVEFENGTRWMPALVDIGDIISKLGKCEDLKYPDGEGFRYTMRFFNGCFNKSRRQIEELYRSQFNPNNLNFSK